MFWTVKIEKSGSFQVISEDNGHEALSYELITPTDTLEVYPKGNVGKLTKKPTGTINIVKKGTIIIKAYPKEYIEWWNKFSLKGVELVLVK